MTAVNDEGGRINIACDDLGEETIPKMMQRYKARSEAWMLMVDDNCEYLSFRPPDLPETHAFRKTVRVRHVNTPLSSHDITVAH